MNGRLVRLTVVPNEPEAEMIRALLATAGIDSTQRRSDVAAGAWEGLPAGGAREVLAHATDLGAARELIAGGQ